MNVLRVSVVLLLLLLASCVPTTPAARCPPPSAFTPRNIRNNIMRFESICWEPLSGGFARQVFQDVVNYGRSCAIDSLYAQQCSRGQARAPFYQNTCTYQFIRLLGSFGKSSSWGRPVQISLVPCSRVQVAEEASPLPSTTSTPTHLVNGMPVDVQ